MPSAMHGKYHLSEPLRTLQHVEQVIIQKGMFEWRGKLLSHAFIVNLPLAQILLALKYGNLRHAMAFKTKSTDATP